MWDSNSPLQLLKSMPSKLSKENLEKLQLVIDADKYKNSLVSGFDLCGMYAPFCKGCKKTSIFPCAIAYVNMMRAEGMDIEIDAKPVMASAVVTEKVPVQENTSVGSETAITTDVADVAFKKTADEHSFSSRVAEPIIEETVPTEVKEKQTEKIAKRKIRIAVARKKIY